MKKFLFFAILFSLTFTQFSCEEDTLSAHRQEIRDYLESEGKLEDAIETDDGVFIYFTEQGIQGPETPSLGSFVNVQYTGYLFPDGETFDSSNGITQQWQLGVTSLISGMTLGLQELKAGDRAEIYIPSVLGYGNFSDQSTSTPGVVIEAGSILTFDIYMVSFFN